MSASWCWFQQRSAMIAASATGMSQPATAWAISARSQKSIDICIGSRVCGGRPSAARAARGILKPSAICSICSGEVIAASPLMTLRTKSSFKPVPAAMRSGLTPCSRARLKIERKSRVRSIRRAPDVRQASSGRRIGSEAWLVTAHPLRASFACPAADGPDQANRPYRQCEKPQYSSSQMVASIDRFDTICTFRCQSWCR